MGSNTCELHNILFLNGKLPFYVFFYFYLLKYIYFYFSVLVLNSTIS